MGFLYLIIGLFTIARDARPRRHLLGLCLCSFGVYVITPAGPHDTLWRIGWVTEDLYRAFLPALLLHFFLCSRARSATARRAAPLPPAARVHRPEVALLP